MLYRDYIPRPPLSEFVELLWYSEGSDQTHEKERVLPTGTMELIINLRDDALRVYDRRNHERFESFGSSLVCGAHSEFFVIDTASQASIMGVHFKPGGALPFLGSPADELRNSHASLDAFWGAGAARVRERLLEAGTPEMKFRVLEQILLERLARSPRRHPAVAFALEEFLSVPHTRTVSEVAGRIGLSQRRFIQLFREEVGMTPKLFCRVRRFQEALRLADEGRRVEWADVAAGCGYFDQAHFIRDFQAFSSLTPTTYLTSRSDHLNHVPLRDR